MIHWEVRRWASRGWLDEGKGESFSRHSEVLPRRLGGDVVEQFLHKDFGDKTWQSGRELVCCNGGSSSMHTSSGYDPFRHIWSRHCIDVESGKEVCRFV